MAHRSLRYGTALGVLLSLALLAYVFSRVDLVELAHTLAGANLGLVVVAVLTNYGVIALKGLRWKEILASSARVSFGDSTFATLLGFCANTLLPARGGELVRVLLLGRRYRLSRTMLIGSLVADHGLEGAGLGLVMLALPLLIPLPSWMRGATLAVVGATLAALVLVPLALHAGTRAAALFARLPERFRAWFARRTTQLQEGFAVLRSAPKTVWVVALSLLGWAAQAAMVATCLWALGLEADLARALFVLVAVNVAGLIPTAPGGLGAFELAAVLALGTFGVGHTAALSFALLYHLAQLLPTLLAGFVALGVYGLRFGELVDEARES